MAKDDMEFHFFDVKNIDKTEERVVADIPQDDSLNIAVKCCEETNEVCWFLYETNIILVLHLCYNSWGRA